MQRKVLELVVPVLNEEDNLRAFCAEVDRVLAPHALALEWRIVFVDDGSSDKSWALLRDLAGSHANVRAIRLNRNYGAHVAISAGLACSDADAVVVLAADLQDPPDVIPRFLESWEQGHRVVWGVRSMRVKETLVRRVLTRVFYRLVRRYALPTYPPQGTGSFCLIDRVVVQNIRRMREDFRTIFGLVAIQGFPAAEVPYVRRERMQGVSGWSMAKLVRTAIDVFTSYSHLPVRVITWVGLVSCVLAMLAIVYQVIWYFVYPGTLRGWTMLFATICFFGGIQTLALGVLGEYIWRTFHEVKRRPLWFVDEATFDLERQRG